MFIFTVLDGVWDYPGLTCTSCLHVEKTWWILGIQIFFF